MKFFILLFLSFFIKSSQAQLVDRVQAQAGQEMISFSDFKNFKHRLRSQLISLPSSLKLVYKKPDLLKNKERLLDFMIARSILSQTASAQKGLEIPEREIKKQLDQIKNSRSYKKSSHKNLMFLRREVLINLRIDFLINQLIVPKIFVSEQDIESYHFKKYQKPLWTNFEYEFVSFSFHSDQKQRILDKIRPKEIFDLKNTAVSLGLDYKKSKLKGKDIQQQFKKELDRLSVSQISPLIVLGDFYYMLQLIWKSPLPRSSEKKIKAQIEKILYEQKLKKEIERWIEQKTGEFLIQKQPF